MNREIFLLAGEPSGDARGAELIRALRSMDPTLRFAGMGGSQMKAEGMEVHTDLSSVAVVGIIEVLKSYRFFRKTMTRLLDEAIRRKPVAVVGIDYPGFNLRFFRAIRKQSMASFIRTIQYISPQLWAWDEKRKWQMAKDLDLVLCIFPFEPPFYAETGLQAIYVGHPLNSISAAPLSQRNPNVVAFFPGSRERELRQHLPALIETQKILRRENPALQCIFASHHPRNEGWIRSYGHHLAIAPPEELFSHAGCGAICSGTATLEATLHGLPICVFYRVAWPTYWMGRFLIKVPYLAMPNLLVEKPLVKELIQSDLTPTGLAREILRLLRNPTARRTLEEGYAQIRSVLGTQNAAQRAAEEILRLLN